MTKLHKIPRLPGIYLFYNKKKDLVYVGKAVDLRSRVRSYFSNTQKNPRPIEIMIHEVADVKWKETGSVLEAIILEGNYIKRYQPKYNVDWKDDKSWNYIVITDEDFPKVKTIRSHEYQQYEKGKLEISNWKSGKLLYVFGPYPGLKTREMVRTLQRLFFISTCKPCQPGKSCKPCFYYQMGQCLGVCTGEISPKEYKQKVIRPLTMFLSGNKKGVIRDLEKRMRAASKTEDFEEATRLRNQIVSLRRIQDIALLNNSFVKNEKLEIGPPVGGWKLGNNYQLPITNYQITRIEGYDISNLGASGMVGSMVVFDTQSPVKSQYRKFKIKTVKGQSDVDCLEEVIKRRFKHDEWIYPDIILVDGGKPQVSRALKVLREFQLDIPVVGIAKGSERKKNEFIYVQNTKYTKVQNREIVRWIDQHRELLICVRDEAHRFAISYQKKLREIK